MERPETLEKRGLNSTFMKSEEQITKLNESQKDVRHRL